MCAGTLPSEWSGMSSLSYILLSNNNFRGAHCWRLLQDVILAH